MQHRSSSALHRWTTTGMFAIDQLRCTRKCLLGRHCSVSEQLIYAAKHLTASVLRSWPTTGMVAIDQLYCSCKCLGVIAQFQDRSFMFVPCAIKRAVSLHNYTHVCYRSVTLARFGRHCSVSGQLMHVPNIVNQACNITLHRMFACMFAIDLLRCACKYLGVIAQFQDSSCMHLTSNNKRAATRFPFLHSISYAARTSACLGVIAQFQSS
jgi:hypothetical protein